MDQPIEVFPETTAAFVGRSLRGPLDTPVLVTRFAEFRRIFGDTWHRSSLGPALRQFFDNGGGQAWVVRVANRARGAMLCIPANGSAMILRAVQPGSTEQVRAAIDYDNVSDDDSFNLTLQRLDPATGLPVDQEIHDGLSFQADSDRFVGERLLGSGMARLEAPYPTRRPEPTGAIGQRQSAWVAHAQDGTDGVELSDYDLIGTRHRGTGLFALEAAEHFDLLYLPPPGKHRDAGPAAVLAAERYCRQRGAMLIVDPPLDAINAEDAVNSFRRRGYSSSDMLSYFPRLHLRDDPGRSSCAAGGAIAGLLCRRDREAGPWRTADGRSPPVLRGMKPESRLDEREKALLQRAGVNPVVTGSAGTACFAGSTTMGSAGGAPRVFANLPIRRLCLRIINTIDLATRWTIFEAPDAALARSVEMRILTYLSELGEAGAIASDRLAVHVDVDDAASGSARASGIRILVVFLPPGADGPVSFSLHQAATGFRVASAAFAPTNGSVSERHM